MGRIDGCINCGEVRELLALNLCPMCYRRDERARKRPVVDRHNPGIRQDQKKLLKGFTAVMAALSDVGVMRDDVSRIREILEPYLEPIAALLAPAAEPRQTDSAHDTEQQDDTLFSVQGQPLLGAERLSTSEDEVGDRPERRLAK